MRQIRLVLTVMGLVTALVSTTAHAQVTWTGTTGNGDWATPNAFADSSGGLTLANGFSRAFVFAGTPAIVSTTNTLTGGTSTGFTFNAGASPFTLDGNAITLAGNITNSSTNVQTIALAMNSTANRTVTMTAGGGNVTLSGVLSGAGGYSTAGSGTLRITGNNTYTGNTSIGAGGNTLVIGHENALGTSGSLTFGGNGAFDVTTGSSFTIANNIYLSGGSGTFFGSGNLTLTGTLQFGGATRTLTVSSGTLTTPMIDAVGTDPTIRLFVKAGAGTLIVTGAAGADFRGGFRHDAGLLILGTGSAVGTGTFDLNGGTLQGSNDLKITSNAGISTNSTVSGTRTIEFAGRIQTSARSLTNSISSGTLIISGSAVSNPDAFTLNGTGATLFSGTAQGGVAGQGRMNFSPGTGGVITISGLVNTGTAAFGGTGTIIFTNSNAIGPSTAVILDGPITGSLRSTVPLSIAGPTSLNSTTNFGGTGSITFTGTATFPSNSRGFRNNIDPAFGTLTFAGPVVLNPQTGWGFLDSGTGNTIVSGIVSGGGTTSELRLASTGTTTLSAANTYSGTTTISGALVLGNNAALGSSVLLPAAATATVRATTAVTTTNAVFLQGFNLAIAGTNSLGFGSLTNFTSGRVVQNFLPANATLSFSGTTFLQESGTGIGRNLIIAGSGNTTFSGAIVNGGTAGLSSITINSTGTTTLAGANAYFGTTTVNAGVLLLSTTAAVSGSAARPYTVSGSAVIATGFALDQAFLLRTATASAGVVALAANSSGNLDFSAATGADLPNMSLGAVGPGTRVYSGTVTPNGTTYRIGGAGGTLDFQGPLTGANALVLGGSSAAGGGSVILSNTSNSFSGLPTVQMGSVEVSLLNDQGLNSPLGTSGTISLGSGTNIATLRYVGSGHATNRLISLAGSSGGRGVLDSSGSGPVTFTGGVMSASGLTLTLTGSNTGNNYVEGIISGSVVKTGVGTWVMGSNSFSGGLRVEQGTVIAAAAVTGSFSPIGRTGTVDPVIGLANASGTAALLVASGFEIGQAIEVAAPGTGNQEVILGGSGTGSSAFADRILRLGRDVTLAADPGGTVRFAVETGNWQTLSGASGTTALTIGTPTATGTVTFQTTLPNTIPQVTVRQGTLRLGNSGTTGALGPATVLTGSAGATLAFNRSDTITSGVDFAATISGGLNVRQIGAGTTVLAGVNTYTGATGVDAGTLRVDGVLGNTAVTVALGATLTGTGTIGGPTTILGTHSPGSSPGIETFTNGLTYGATSTLVWELIANTDAAGSRGALFDGVDLTGGALSIANGATLSLVFNLPGSTVDWNDPFWGTGRSWTVIDVAGGTWNSSPFTTLLVGNDADGFSLGSKRPDGSFQIVASGGDLLLEYVIVPEPGAIALAGIGLAAAARGWRRRRRIAQTRAG